MKIGFSSLVCPQWNLEAIVSRAAEFGFDGVELRGLRGELHLPLVPELAANPERVRSLFAERKVELVCLASSATLSAKRSIALAKQKSAITEFIELASKLHCPYIRMYAGEAERWDNQRAALGRIAQELTSLVPILARHGVTLLVENGGDFSGSDDMWFLVDFVNHPSVRICWNQCNALMHRERPTNSIPRLGGRLGMVHLCDASFDADGILIGYQPLGAGDAEVARQIELLRGLAYDRYLMFEHPKMWVPSLPEPEAALPATAKYLRDRLAEKQPILSAYKGDKNAPRFVSRPTTTAMEG